MRIAIISVHFVTVPCDSVRAFVCCHRQLPYTTYHIISTTYGRLILRRTYNLITITDLIIFLIIFNFFLICYRHLQEPSAVAFFFYSRIDELVSICHAALEIDKGWNSRMLS